MAFGISRKCGRGLLESSLGPISVSGSSASSGNPIRGKTPAPGDIVLARFKVESQFSLGNALSALGMEIAFRRQADFSGICAENLWIDRVLHRTFLKVDEKGTEAAAATAVGMLRGMPERFSMIFDHPFFCAVRDSRTDEIFFAAAVVNPAQ